MTPATLQTLLAARNAARPVVLATRLADGAQIILPGEAAPPSLVDAAANALGRDKSEVVEIDGVSWFIHVHAPAYRLIIVGAVHIGQALVETARVLGYRITVVDPRKPFNSADRFGGVERVHDWPDQAVDRLAPDARTAVIALTHDPKLDDPALDRALRSPAGFIGALGSRRSQAARLTRLAALGHDAASLARVRGPVGLPLGSVSAPEIALSIVAEIVAVRRRAALGRARMTVPADGAAPRVAALVLAAGRSTRMAPHNKLLLRDVTGSAMVARVVAACAASKVAHIVVVTGYQADAVRRAVHPFENLSFVDAPDHAAGLSASLRAGMRALPRRIGGVIVCLGDMPLVGSGLIDRMIAAFAPACGRAIVVPVWQGQRGNPVLWGEVLFADICSVSGDAGARCLLALHSGMITTVEADDSGVLTDYDTPESLSAPGSPSESWHATTPRRW